MQCGISLTKTVDQPRCGFNSPPTESYVCAHNAAAMFCSLMSLSRLSIHHCLTTFMGSGRRSCTQPPHQLVTSTISINRGDKSVLRWNITGRRLRGLYRWTVVATVATGCGVIATNVRYNREHVLETKRRKPCSPQWSFFNHDVGISHG